MAEHLVIECPICGKQRLCPPAGTSTDEAISIVGRHVFERHPATPPAEAERVIGEAVDGMGVATVDGSAVERGRWDEYGVEGSSWEDDPPGEP